MFYLLVAYLGIGFTLFDPSPAPRSGEFKGKHESQDMATPEIQKNVERMAKLQYLLYADDSRSLLIVRQALDAGGKALCAMCSAP